MHDTQLLEINQLRKVRFMSLILREILQFQNWIQKSKTNFNSPIKIIVLYTHKSTLSPCFNGKLQRKVKHKWFTIVLMADLKERLHLQKKLPRRMWVRLDNGETEVLHFYPSSNFKKKKKKKCCCQAAGAPSSSAWIWIYYYISALWMQIYHIEIWISDFAVVKAKFQKAKIEDMINCVS